MYACLAVTCHLHFGQNDRDLLRATAVTRGWNGYRNTEESAQKVADAAAARTSPEQPTVSLPGPHFRI